MSETSILNTESEAPVEGITEEGKATEANGIDGKVMETSGKEGVQDWRSALPEDLRDEPSLKSFTDIANLAKSYVHAQKMVGADKVTVPNKHFTEEDWRNFYVKTGHLPEKFEDYNVNTDEELQELVSEERLNNFKDFAYKNNLSPSQADALLNYHKEVINEERAQHEEQLNKQREEALAFIKREYGEATEMKLALAREAMSELGGEEFSNKVDEMGWGNDPDFINFMVKVGEATREPSVSASNRDSGGMTPKDLDAAIESIRGDFNHPYHDKHHVNHEKAVKEMEDLYRRRYASEDLTAQ